MQNSKLQFKIQNIFSFKLLLFVFIFTFCVFGEANAATLYFESSQNEYAVDDVFSVDVMLDTQGEEINAVDVRVIFSKDLVEFKDYSDGGSVISFWIDIPKIYKQNGADNEQNDAEISFSGLVPGGVNSPDVYLLTLFFKGLKEGDVFLDFWETSEVLLNDGHGTPTDLRFKIYDLRIANSRGGGVQDSRLQIQISDETPPEVFEPMIASEPTVFEGQWFLSVVAQDKESGVDRYEIVEYGQNYTGDEQKYAELPWKIVESPYVLKDQERKSYIYVKVVDKAGNQSIKVVKPLNPQSTYTQYYIWGIIIVAIIMAVFLVRKRIFKH